MFFRRTQKEFKHVRFIGDFKLLSLIFEQTLKELETWILQYNMKYFVSYQREFKSIIYTYTYTYIFLNNAF